jgi:hypothetical protein
MKQTLTIPSHVELTIRRPSGEVETVVIPTDRARELSDGLFAQIVAATKAAGRGDVLAYKNCTKDVIESDQMYAERLAGEAADREYYASKRLERMMAYGEADECQDHGSRRELVIKGEMD